MKKQLGIFDLTMIMVSFVIGMGIFRTPVNVAQATPDILTYFLCWLAGGLVALCGALTYAEIGARMPSTGGYYRVFAYAYHPSIAFAINCIILVSNAASLAAVALVGSEYITGVVFPQATDTTTPEVMVAIVSVIIFYGVNMLGLKMSSRTQNLLMLVKIGLVILLILPVFFAETPPLQEISSTASATPGIRDYIKSFGIGLVAVSFTFGGYQQTINFGDEVKNASRTLPRSIFAGILLIVTLYMLVNYAYVKVIGFETLKESKNIAAIMAAQVLGPKAEIILSVLLFLGVLGYINGSLLSNPRVMYAMSRDGVLPALCGRTNKKGVLVASLSIFSAIAVLVVFWAEAFDRILSFTIFLDCFGMALSAASIFVIRRKTAHLDGTGIYKMRWYPLLPILFIITYIFIAVSITLDYRNNGYAALIGSGVLLFFMGIYFAAYHGRDKRKTS